MLDSSLSFVRNIYFLRVSRWTLIAELDVATSRACPIESKENFLNFSCKSDRNIISLCNQRKINFLVTDEIEKWSHIFILADEV